MASPAEQSSRAPTAAVVKALRRAGFMRGRLDQDSLEKTEAKGVPRQAFRQPASRWPGFSQFLRASGASHTFPIFRFLGLPCCRLPRSALLQKLLA